MEWLPIISPFNVGSFNSVSEILVLLALKAPSHHIMTLRATSHTSLRARDHYISSTLIGGKGGVGPSSLHTTLEGPMEFVNARWM